MGNQQVIISSQKATRTSKGAVSNAVLKNLASFLDELIKIDLKQKSTLSGGKPPLMSHTIKAGSNNEEE